MPGRTKSHAAGVDQKPDDTTMEDAPASAQAAAEGAQEGAEFMDERVEDNVSGGVNQEEDEEDIQRVRILPGSSATAASFEFLDEGHTLGNALRYIIMKNPDVEFCAYAIPHPSEAKMNIRIQTYDTTTAAKALAKGLQDLEDLCDVVADKFWSERNSFVEKMQESD
ncbi:DNA-directed RNA polymerase [Xylariales sp. AK1849]|nr:DNA-directed RNA polymerase [Xylariales sp. AK1849]